MSSVDTPFEAVTGYFVYDQVEKVPGGFPAVDDNFGLLPSQTWSQLVGDLKRFNSGAQSAGSNEQYKLVFAARHGEGFHNVAEAKYGTEAWDAKWAMLTGDGELVWGPDPELTPLGEDQARAINDAWKQQLVEANAGKDAAPLPTKLFSSPMKRSSRTLQLSYEGILLPPGTIPKGPNGKQVGPPYVKEDLREQYGNDNTCIARSTKTQIQRNFPRFEIEPGFSEEDQRFKVRLQEADGDSGKREEGSKGRTMDVPLITEGLRENYRDEHTCDERSTRSVIAKYNEGWEIEEGFSEEDRLFGVSPRVCEYTTSSSSSSPSPECPLCLW